jgi:cysteine desulfurase
VLPNTPINLDSNATTQPTQEVIDAATDALTRAWHNPSSVHRAGQEARRTIELARAHLAALIHAPAKAITLHASGTESIDQAIRGVLLARPTSSPAPPIVVSTKVEHAAVRDLIDHLEARGLAQARWLAVDRNGRVDLDDAAKAITPGVTLVTVQWANNETGTLQPLGAIARLVRTAQAQAQAQTPAIPGTSPGPLLHTDATQWVGKLPALVVTAPPPQQPGPEQPVNQGDPLDPTIDCDLLTFSPHKFHGPKGVGVLYRRPGVRLVPTLIGTQELGRRGGTENVAAIAGAGVAAQQASEWLADEPARVALAKLRDAFEQAVVEGVRALGVHAQVNAAAAPRLWNTSNIAFDRLEAEALLLAFSERGLWASAGAACSSGSLDPSPVLLALGLAPRLAHGSIRFSLSRFTTPKELNAATAIVVHAVARLARSMPQQASPG